MCCRRDGRAIIIVAVVFRVLNFILIACAMSAATPWWYLEYKNDSASVNCDVTTYYAYDQVYESCDKKGNANLDLSCDSWTSYTDKNKAGTKFKDTDENMYDELQQTKRICAASLAFAVIVMILCFTHIFLRRSAANATGNHILKHVCWIIDVLLMILLVANCGQFASNLPDKRLKDCKKQNTGFSDSDCYKWYPGSKYFAGTLEISSLNIKYTYGGTSGFALSISAAVFCIVTLVLTCVLSPSEKSKAVPMGVAGPYQRIEGGGAVPATVGVAYVVQPQPVAYSSGPAAPPPGYVSQPPVGYAPAQPGGYAYGQPAAQPYAAYGAQPAYGAPPPAYGAPPPASGAYGQPQPYTT